MTILKYIASDKNSEKSKLTTNDSKNIKDETEGDASLIKQLIIIVLVCIIVWVTTGLLFYKIHPDDQLSNKLRRRITLEEFASPKEEKLVINIAMSPSRSSCMYHTCFNVYRCGHGLKIYIYPPVRYLDYEGIPISETPSREYFEILEAIMDSKYYETDPSKACIFIPSIDTLNQNRLRPAETSQALHSLAHWGIDGENHLIFNMIAGAAPDYNTVIELALGKAMVAGAGFDTWSYQQGFDISLPLFSPSANLITNLSDNSRPWLILSSQTNIHREYQIQLELLSNQNSDNLFLLKSCGNSSLRCSGDIVYHYPQVLQHATFCLVLRGARLAQPILIDALAAGCIPIILADSLVMPFSEVIDWKRAAVFLPESDIELIVSRVRMISDDKRKQMKAQSLWLYQNYFKTIRKVIKTTLKIIEDRIYPHNSQTYPTWNLPTLPKSVQTPLFLSLTAPRSHGFTAVVLTYDRVDSLFQLVTKLSLAPSLAKILVLWNNQNKSPPAASLWPRVNKPLRVIKTEANKLSNRFYPYADIETEAILTIDDDIVMLTADELEFGYEVWREFPDRIVGFPSRTHVWDNITERWRYQSEWTNHISLVLTGAAFHHKYWSYLYTTGMPANIKEWVDEHMNCEDIAMNFLVANATRKAPIKVTPRKKFKCPECTNTEMLSADLNHMAARSECIHRFASIYGTMPLQTVEFRADPVLYRDNFPTKLKRFNDVGSL